MIHARLRYGQRPSATAMRGVSFPSDRTGENTFVRPASRPNGLASRSRGSPAGMFCVPLRQGLEGHLDRAAVKEFLDPTHHFWIPSAMWSNTTPTDRCSLMQLVVRSAYEQPPATAMTSAITASYSSARSDALM
jgi:hypothetical protein